MHFPLVPGDSGPEVTRWQEWFADDYAAYAPPVTGIYDAASVAATTEMQRRLSLKPTGNFNIQTAKASGYIQQPVFITVEGHSSNMFAGPVADTANQLEREGLCHHQPIGYNNGAIPFDNQSGVSALFDVMSSTQLVAGDGRPIPFPLGTPIILGAFSQGMIIAYDCMEQHFGPGGDLERRKDDFLGFLFYGNPCRATNSGGTDGTHGLDPLKRFGLPGCYPQPENVYEVWRNGDIFAQNTDDLKGRLKAAIYQAVARGDFFSNPYSLVAELLSQLPAVTTQNYFELLTFGIGIVQAIASGVVFLADNPNPHYSPYDISGGLSWARNLLT